MTRAKPPKLKCDNDNVSSHTSEKQRQARMALAPTFNAASVITAYQNNVMGEVDFMALVQNLHASCERSRNGDLRELEDLLFTQAMTLQTLFASLARRAQSQQYQKHFEAFMGLALKAQAQSRATIQAVVELKYPRQVAIVNQANISHWPQQINNAVIRNPVFPPSRADQINSAQNKLLVEDQHGSTQMDGRATAKAGRSDPGLATVAAVKRSKKCNR